MPSSQFKAVLFDLDGTLLQVEMRHFIPRYVSGFHTCCSDLFTFERLQRAMRAGIHLLIGSEDGTCSNEDRLFGYLAECLTTDEGVLRERFQRYLSGGFDALADAVQPIPEAKQLIASCLRAGVPVVLATNPVFPRALIEARCRWAGLGVEQFSLLTSFENSCYCKPQGGYFREVAARLGVEPRKCLMIGNDTSHDLAASEAGMTTWLVDRYLLERDGPSFEPDHRGDHGVLLDYLRQTLVV